MRTIIQKRQFKKDYKRIARLGRDTARLFEIIGLLQADDRLPENCRDHALAGNWKSFRECHLGGDWLLIYQKTERLLVLIRTGSHNELFR
jgi:mRNA interferase YafQ